MSMDPTTPLSAPPGPPPAAAPLGLGTAPPGDIAEAALHYDPSRDARLVVARASVAAQQAARDAASGNPDGPLQPGQGDPPERTATGERDANFQARQRGRGTLSSLASTRVESAPPPLSLHHVGIAVHGIEEAMRFYGDTLGLERVDERDLPDRGLRVAFVDTGNTLIELLQSTDPEGTVAKFLERRGPGLHHICFGTDDIDTHLRELQEKGVALIDAAARPGAHGDVAFIHPSASFGVLVELIEPTHPAPATGLEPTPLPATDGATIREETV